MPNRKTRLKLTGDTHPPEVEHYADADDEPFEPQADTRAFTRRFADQPGINPSPGAYAMRRPAPAPIPYRQIAMTLAAVYVIAKLLRL